MDTKLNLQSFPQGTVGNILAYTNAGAAWSNADYVSKTGDTMTGDLTLTACTLHYNSTNESLEFKF